MVHQVAPLRSGGQNSSSSHHKPQSTRSNAAWFLGRSGPATWQAEDCCLAALSLTAGAAEVAIPAGPLCAVAAVPSGWWVTGGTWVFAPCVVWRRWQTLQPKAGASWGHHVGLCR